MVHKGYNELVTTTSIGEQWKYQGQERTFDLGLNTDQWKYRISDPSIGRFWQIDPLAEDYVYNATYAFAENKIIANYELEGLEAVSIHTRSLPLSKHLEVDFQGMELTEGLQLHRMLLQGLNILSTLTLTKVCLLFQEACKQVTQHIIHF